MRKMGQQLRPCCWPALRAFALRMSAFRSAQTTCRAKGQGAREFDPALYRARLKVGFGPVVGGPEPKLQPTSTETCSSGCSPKGRNGASVLECDPCSRPRSHRTAGQAICRSRGKSIRAVYAGNPTPQKYRYGAVLRSPRQPEATPGDGSSRPELDHAMAELRHDYDTTTTLYYDVAAPPSAFGSAPPGAGVNGQVDQRLWCNRGAAVAD